MAAQRAYTTHPLVLRRVTVRRVHEVTPRMRRVVLGGDDLAAFTRDGTAHPAFAAPGFDDHIKLILASTGTSGRRSPPSCRTASSGRRPNTG